MSDNTEWARELDLAGVTHEYILGVEVGMLFTSLKLMRGGEVAGIEIPGIDGIMMTVHTSNAEMIARLADRFECRVKTHELSEDFMDVSFWKEDQDREEGRAI